MPPAPRQITDGERRARLVARHHLARTAPDALEAVRGVAAMHSTDPATPFLGVRARVSGFELRDLDRALYDTRSLCRIHAMRRTLFVVPTDALEVFEAGASREVARSERKRLEGWLRAEVDAGRMDGPGGPWLTDLESRTLAALADGAERRTQDLIAAVPELGTEITLGSGKWTVRAPISSRLLFLLAMEGRVVRTRAAGSWRSSQYRWARTEAWFGGDASVHRSSGHPEPTGRMEEGQGRAHLVRRYLATHGPATVDDVRWWTGWTKARATAALAHVEAAPVLLDSGATGFVLPGDELPGAAEGAAAADGAGVVCLLPALDPSPMGWKERGWYLGPHAVNGGPLFDRNGNVGPTVWRDGSVIGGWAQRPGGEVVFQPLEDVGAQALSAVRAEADALGAWLAGEVVMPRFPTPLQRELAGG